MSTRASSVSVNMRIGFATRYARSTPSEWVMIACASTLPIDAIASSRAALRVSTVSVALADRREQPRLVLGSQRAGDLPQVAVHDRVDPVQREVDAMVGDAPLREVVGADAVGTIAGADEALPLARLLRVRLALLLVLDARGEHTPGLLAVLVLAPRVLALDHDAGRKVGEAHRRVGLVHVLATCSARAVGVHAHVGGVDFHVGRLGLRHHRHGGRRRVDAPLGLGGRHALHAVPAGLELELRIGTCADHARDHLLVATGVARALRDDLDLPAVPLGEARVHPQKVAREERAFVPARAGADLEEEVLLVVGIARQQHALQVLLERGGAAPALAQLLLGEGTHARVARHLLGGRDVRLGAAPSPERFDHRLDLGALLRELAQRVAIVAGIGIGKPAVDLPQPRLQAGELRLARVLHAVPLRRAARASAPVAAPASGSSGTTAPSARRSRSRSASPARVSAWRGWCRNLLVMPRERASRTAAGSSPRARRPRARASSISRYRSALRRSSTMAGT